MGGLGLSLLWASLRPYCAFHTGLHQLTQMGSLSAGLVGIAFFFPRAAQSVGQHVVVSGLALIPREMIISPFWVRVHRDSNRWE